MDTFLVSATCRHSGPHEPSGYLFTIDLAERRVTGCCPVIEPPHRDADPNPRGGMRGAKGIAVAGDRVFVANASVVHCFDSAWDVVGAVSHPSCGSLHDIVWRDGTLWVTSCCNDLLCQLDLEGRLLDYFSPRDDAELCRDAGWSRRACSMPAPSARGPSTSATRGRTGPRWPTALT
jgi:hypothetical protein